MPAKPIKLTWPTGGLFKRLAYSEHPRNFTADCLNVWPDDVLEGRERGGSRPGLAKYRDVQLGSGNPVRSVADIWFYTTLGGRQRRFMAIANGILYRSESNGDWVAVPSSGAEWYWTFSFQGSLANTDVAEGTPVGSPNLTITTTTAGGGGSDEVQKYALDFTYRPDVAVAEWPGKRWRAFPFSTNVYLPENATEEEVQNQATTFYGAGNVAVNKVFTGSLTLNSAVELALADRAQTLFIADYAPVESQETDGVLATSSTFTSAAGGSFTGVTAYDFSLVITDGGTGTTQIQRLEMTGTPTGGTFRLSWSIDGEFYQTEPIAYNASAATIQTAVRKAFVDEHGQVIGTLTFGGGPFPGTAVTFTPSGNYSNRDNPLIEADVSGLTGGTAPVGIEIRVSTEGGPADGGSFLITNITGNTITFSPANRVSSSEGMHYYIARNPKQYDPIDDAITVWKATDGKGSVPLGCPLMCLWRDRLVLAGASNAPHQWYMSRQGDPYDWDYSIYNDAGAAVAGQASLAGQLGEKITALIPHSDDCLIIGCASSLWIMRGDPAAGGRLDRLSANIGVYGANSWCYTPEGYLYFLSNDGVYEMAPGCGSVPQSVSREVLPEDMLLDNSLQAITAVMRFDVRTRIIYLSLTPETAATDTVHYALDVKTVQNRDSGTSASFWPMTMSTSYDPFSMYSPRDYRDPDSTVIIGCRDGYVRYFDADSASDDGTTFSSYLWFGPIKLDDVSDAMLHELVCTLADDSGPVTWEVKSGKSAEQCVNATPVAAGTFWNKGFNPSAKPRIRGGAVMIKLAGKYLGQSWALEALTATMAMLGKRRM